MLNKTLTDQKKNTFADSRYPRICGLSSNRGQNIACNKCKDENASFVKDKKFL